MPKYAEFFQLSVHVINQVMLQIVFLLPQCVSTLRNDVRRNLTQSLQCYIFVCYQWRLLASFVIVVKRSVFIINMYTIYLVNYLHLKKLFCISL